MKRKRATCLKSCSSQQQLLSSPKSTVMVGDDFYLPEECWEHVFKFLIRDEDNNSSLESLSLVSKQFLSITNRLRSSISINDQGVPYLIRIFQRFTKLTSLKLRCCSGDDIHKYLSQLYDFSLNPTLLDLSYERTNPDNGLQAFSQNISALTSLTCSSVNFLHINTNMFLIVAHCFPNLQRLDLRYCYDVPGEGIGHVLNRCCNIRHLNLEGCSGLKLHGMNFEAPKLEVLNLSYTKVDDETLNIITKSCRGLLQLYLEACYCVTEKGVMHVVKNCAQLRKINLRGCKEVRGDVVELLVFSRPLLRKIVAPSHYPLNESIKEFCLHHGCRVCD